MHSADHYAHRIQQSFKQLENIQKLQGEPKKRQQNKVVHKNFHKDHSLNGMDFHITKFWNKKSINLLRNQRE